MGTVQPRDRELFNLPARVFLYTLDQISSMLATEDDELKALLHYRGRSFGPRKRGQIECINIALPTELPNWRVEEEEFVRWCRHVGFRSVERYLTAKQDHKSRDLPSADYYE